MAALPGILLARRGVRSLALVPGVLITLALLSLGHDPRGGFGQALAYGPPGEMADLLSPVWYRLAILIGFAIVAAAALAIMRRVPAQRVDVRGRELLAAVAVIATAMFVLDAVLDGRGYVAHPLGSVFAAGALVFGIGWDARSFGRVMTGVAILLVMYGEGLFRLRDALLIPHPWISSWGALHPRHVGVVVATVLLAMVTMPLARILERLHLGASAANQLPLDGEVAAWGR